MGDIADQLNEEGMENFLDHLNGICEDFCQYCAEEARPPYHKGSPQTKAGTQKAR